MGLDRVVHCVRYRVRGRFRPSRRLVLVRRAPAPQIASRELPFMDDRLWPACDLAGTGSVSRQAAARRRQSALATRRRPTH